MNWLDLGIIIFLVIFLIVGIKKGLMNAVLSNFSLGINCLISFFLCRPFKYIIGNWFGLNNKLFNHYYDGLINLENNSYLTRNLMNVSEKELSSVVKTGIDEGGFNFIPKTMFKIFLNKKNLYSTLHNAEPAITETSVAKIAARTYSNFFVTIIAFVITLALVFITVKLFQAFVNKLRTIGFVKAVDNILGAVYGVCACLIILVVLSTLIKLLSVFSFMNPVVTYINSSLFGQFIYAQISDFLNNYLSFSDIIASIFKH